MPCNLGSDLELITIKDPDYRAFRGLLLSFKRKFLMLSLYDETGNILRSTQTESGRRRSLTAFKSSALVLTWHQTHGPCFTLSTFLLELHSKSVMCLYYSLFALF